MTGLVFGNDLGLFNSSLKTLKGHFGAGDPALRQGGINHYVNAITGNLVLTDADEILVGRGVDIVAERTYNSQGNWNDSDANGWRFGFERQLVSMSASSVTLTRADGSQVTYNLSNGFYKNTSGDDETGELRKSGSNYIYTDLKSGAKDTYNASGYLISTADADGNTRTYHYSGNKLTEIRFANGERMGFEYNASGSKLSRLKTYANGKWSTEVDYGYDSLGRLAQIKSNLEGSTFVTTYKYSGSTQRISEISQSDGSKVSFTYQKDGKVASVNNGNDQIQTYTYGSDYTQIKDGVNRVRTYYFDSKKRLTRTLTPNTTSLNVSARQLDTRYYYDAQGHLNRINNATAGYDTVKYTYDSAGNRTSAIDAEGNKTEWRYSGKLLLSETVYRNKTSSPATTRYVYDSEKHLRYVVDAEGRVTSNHYTAEGTLSAAITYEGGKYQVSSLPVTTQLSLSQMDSWRNAQNKARTCRTDYFYDARDQLTETRNYARVDSSGAGVLDSATVRTKFVYDQHGLLRQKLAVRDKANFITSYAYDGEGRVTQVTDANGYSTSTVYSGNTVRVTNAEGKITTSAFNEAGQLISVDVSDGSAHYLTRRFYNADGKLAMTQSPTGERAYYFYDEAGRQNTVVSHDGLVSETVYNTAGDVAYSRVYGNRVDTSGWFNGVTVTKNHVSQFRPKANTGTDRTTSFTYDKTGKLTSKTDAEQNAKSTGQVLSHTYYDSTGKVIKTTRGSRTQYFIYDNTGNQTAVIDADGYLTEKKYNARGELVETIQYQTVTDSKLRGSGDLNKLRPAAQASERHSYFYYDGTGRVIATVNAAGELTETAYDEYNNRTWSYHYKSAITASINADTSLSDLQKFAGGAANRTAFRKDFDAAGQVKSTVDAVGITTTFSYNKVGQLTTTSSGGHSVITTYNRFGAATKVQKGNEIISTVYDTVGRKTQQIDGNGNKTLFFYDTSGRLTHTVNALGEVSETTYDGFGQVQETRRYYNRISTSGLSGGAVSTALTGRLKATGSDGRTHSITYDRLGQKISEQNGLNLKSAYTYNEFGELTRSDIWKTTGGLRNITDYTYTARGQRKDTIHYGINAESQADDSLVRYEYDAFGNVVRVWTGNRASVEQRQVRSLFDKAGRERFTLDQAGYVTEKRYDSNGQVVQLIEYNTAFAGSWSDEKSVSDWLAGHAKSGNRVTINAYDNSGRLIRVTDPLGQSESYTYDAAGNKISFTNKQGNTWNYEYDGANHLVREIAPRVTYKLLNSKNQEVVTTRPETQFYYDNNGNLIKQIEGAGTADARTTEYQYDAANRQTIILLPGYYSQSEGKVYFAAATGRVRQVKTVTYNALGLAVAQSDNMGSEKASDWHNSYKIYDRTGRVRYEIDTDSFATEYRYSETGSADSSVKVIRYNNRFKMDGISAGTVISEEMAASRIVADSANDRTLTRYFDRQGRVSRVVGDTIAIYDSALGKKDVAQETQFTYNEFGEVVKERTRIDYDDWAEKYTYYNRAGQKTAQFDLLNKAGGQHQEQGYLTEYSYNAYGQLRETTEYARLVTGTPSLAAAPKAPAQGDANIGFNRHTLYEFDAMGRKIQETRWDDSSNKFYQSGNLDGAINKLVTRIVYDALGNVTAEINAAGGRADKSYDALGHLIKTEGVSHWIANGPNGFGQTKSGRHVTQFVYSIHGDLAQQSDLDSSGVTGSFVTQYQLDARGRRMSVLNGDNITTSYKYDAAGNTLSEGVDIVDQSGHWSGNTSKNYRLLKTYQYDRRGNQIKTDINGRVLQSRYNAFGEVDQSGKAGVMMYTYAYDKAGNLTRKVDTNGDVISLYYDLQGRVTYQLAAGGTGTDDDWATFNTYNRLGFLTLQKLPAHKAGQQPVISQNVDRWGNVTESTNALGGVTKQRYNFNNQVVWEELPTIQIIDNKDALKNVKVTKHYDYDRAGNLIRSTDGLGHSSMRMYDSAGLLLWEKNAIGAVTWYRYDSFGNQTHKKDAVGNYFATRYNKRGLVIQDGQISGSSGAYLTYGLTHTYAYDNAGRRIKDILGTSEEGSNTIYTLYDASGNVTTKRTMEGVVTRYEYNGFNVKTKETNADGRFQQWWYDNYANVTQRRDLSGRITAVQMNAHKQIARETNGDNVNTYSYWNNGLLQSVTRTGNSGWDALAKNLDEWSAHDRTHHTTSVSGLYRKETSDYDYDRMGNRIREHSSSKRQFTRNYQYLESLRYGGSVTKTGSETYVYSFERTTTNKYNARGMLVEVTSPQTEYSPKILQAATSRYGASSIPHIISKTSGLSRLQYFYDEAGNRRKVNVEVLKSNTAGQVENQNHYYTYDSVNRVVLADAKSIAGGYKKGTRSFTYDSIDRRTREIRFDGSRYDHESYAYLYSSGQIKTSSRLDDSTSSSVSAATIKKTAKDYDKFGRLTREYTYATKYGESNKHAAQGAAIQRTDFSWGNGSRLNKQTTYNLRDILREEKVTTYRNDHYGHSVPSGYSIKKVYDHTELRVASQVTYKSYDATGNLTGYDVNIYKQGDILAGRGDALDYNEVHTNTYTFGTAAQQLQSKMTTNLRHWRPNDTTSYYDRFGELMYVRGSNTRSDGYDRMLINNRDGQVLFRRDGKKIQDFYYANGKVLGETGTLSDTNFESYIVGASKMQQAAPGTYAVSNGDTLKGIAQKLWGDSSLWYLIADANAIEPTATLSQGMSLTIPTVNSNIHNNDSTFKPYNPADTIGKIDAEAVFVPPSSGSGCAKMVVIFAVVVVAAIVTYGVSTALTAPAAAGATGAGAAGAGAAGAGTMSAGAAAVVGGAAGAAAGNAAGQLVGIALGVQNGFDLGAVFKAGARGAMAAGVGVMASELSGISGLALNQEASLGQIAARSAMQAGGNYLTNTLLEGHSHFSWKALAANVAGSVAGYYAGQKALGDGQTSMQQFARDVSSSFAGGYAENTARQWMGIGGKRGFEDIAIDAFGNAIGNSLAGQHRAAAEKARVRQIKSFEGVGPIFDWRGTGRGEAEPVTVVSPLSAADDPRNWNWNEEDLMFAEREAALASHFANLDKGQSIGGSWAWSGQCTVDNPYGLSKVEVEQMAWDYVGGRPHSESIAKPFDPYQMITPQIDETGITLAFGASASADAGLGGSAETGSFISINLTKKQITYGDYASIQGGSSAAIPGLGISTSVTFFESPDYEATMEGMYSSHGVSGAFGSMVEAAAVFSYPTGSTPIPGVQVGVGGGTPSFGIYNHVGYGSIIDSSVNTVKFSAIPKELFLHAIGYRQYERTQELLKNYINSNN